MDIFIMGERFLGVGVICCLVLLGGISWNDFSIDIGFM